jgi:hypothetical protein
VISGHTEKCALGGGRFGKFVQTVVKTKGGVEAEMTKPSKTPLSTSTLHRLASWAIVPRSEYRSGEVIGAASTKPYRFQSFRRGPGARRPNADAYILLQNDKKYDLDELARGARTPEAPTSH